MKASKLKYTLSKVEIDHWEDVLFASFILLSLVSSIILPNQMVISNLSNFLLPVVLLWSTLNLSSFSWKKNPFYIWAYLPFILLLSLSPLYHGDYYPMITFGLRYFKLGLIAFLIWQKKDSLTSLLIPGINVIFLLAAIINLISIFNPFGLGIDLLPLYTNHLQNIETNEVINKSFRLFGTFNSPNTNAIFWSISFIYLLSTRKVNHQWWRNPLLICSFGFILLTQSRTGLITFVLSLLIFFLVRSPRLKTFLWLIGSMIIGIIILKFSGLNYLSQVFKYKITQIHSIQLRMEAWESYANIIKTSPIFGQGTIERAIALTESDPDSEYVYAWAVYGIGGLISYLLLMGAYFSRGIYLIAQKHKIPGAFLIAVSILIIINGATTTVFFNDAVSLVFIIFSGIIINLPNYRSHEDFDAR